MSTSSKPFERIVKPFSQQDHQRYGHLIKRTSAKDPPHFPILLRKTSGDGYVWTVWITHILRRTRESNRSVLTHLFGFSFSLESEVRCSDNDRQLDMTESSSHSLSSRV
jgi:hypothetical protein